ncbi:serine hydrolase [Anaerococcus hydrogenalis]|uniref:serine hydrolase n=1 Tax=Anaerococcus hydrogenalis TaxID=33029 RepID=UPI0023F16EEA|nr:serine hydrolase [Anaerococcus hydrogenalis]
MKNKLRYLFIIFLIIIVSIFIINSTNKNTKKNNKRIIIDEKNSNNYVKKKKKEKVDEVGKDKTLSKIIEEIIDQECGNLEGDWQVAVDSLDGDSDISIYKSSNSNIESLPSASTIKIFLALEAYREVEEGILDEKNVENDIYLMLKDSNNESANRLIDLIGNYDMEVSSQKINDTIKKITGENKTGLYRKMLHEGKENMASARDLNMALGDIYFGKFVNKDHSNKIMEAMAENNTTSKFKLLGNLPKDAKGYSKSGEIPDKGVENDIAIISIGDKVFAISFLSQYPNPVSHGQGPQFTCMQNLGKKISKAFLQYN